MKTIHIFFASALAVSALSAITNAQDAPPRGDRPPGRPPMSPVIAALDANKDGEIDATEIANASAALKALDKNGDGKLTRDEIRPPRRDRGPGAPGDRGDRPRGAGDAEKKDAK